jgi:prefoldin alpha subunit
MSSKDLSKEGKEGGRETAQSDRQKKILQFQLLQQQLQQISEQMEVLNQQHTELEASIEALQELEKTKPGQEFLAPLANGIFVKGELNDTSTLLVNVGAEVAVEKDIPQVTALLERQKQEISERLVEADAVLQELARHATKIYKEIEKESGEG